MKKLLLLLAAISFIGTSNASAYTFIDTYWDLNAVDPAYFTVDDGITEPFSQLSYDAITVSQISATGVVVDSGLAYVTAMTPVAMTIPPDSEGLGTSYGMAIVWTDLTGQVTSNDGNTIKADYYSGTIDFYIDYDPYNIVLGNAATFTDGTKVASISVESGGYSLSLDGTDGSSYSLYGTITELLDNFWFDANTGEDLADTLLGLDWLFAYSAGDNDPESVTIINNPDGSITVISDHNSSLSVGVVPEPGTIALLGLGVLGLGFVSYRRNNKQ
ncbi:MAG: hypothetical protein A2X84_09105 [Desulfuromonadaceae bacterium GWC2_58_13]|nr:MAG: hypothetical protein A2X84_09105 [Desulfuromonadaceae bacterium GWC2_58_13]